jgi:hypothetical protein
MHWHIEIAVITIARVHCYMCSLLYSRSVVHQEFIDCMTEADIELILQRGLDAHPLLARQRRSARIFSTASMTIWSLHRRMQPKLVVAPDAMKAAAADRRQDLVLSCCRCRSAVASMRCNRRRSEDVDTSTL